MSLGFQAVARKALGTLRRRAVCEYIEAEELLSIGVLALVEVAPKDEALAVVVARRAMIDAVRRNERRERGRVEPAQENHCGSREEWGNNEHADDPLDVLVSTRGEGLRPAAVHIDLWEAMKALPAREYQIVTLHFWGGRSQAAIADELGINQATVSRAMDSAKKILASCINPESSAITEVRGKEIQRAVPSGRKDAA